jgi:hypothetical protein
MSKLISIKLYYDEYEYEFGDGFYPQLSPFNNQVHAFKPVIFQFIQERNIWKQAFDSKQKAITGLDPPYGEDLMRVLNFETGNIYKATSIENVYGKLIHPK